LSMERNKAIYDCATQFKRITQQALEQTPPWSSKLMAIVRAVKGVYEDFSKDDLKKQPLSIQVLCEDYETLTNEERAMISGEESYSA